GAARGASAGKFSVTSLPRAQWRLGGGRGGVRGGGGENGGRGPRHEPRSNQCTSFVAKHIRAPLQTVWSVLRRFDQPQLFKPFVKKCVMRGSIEVGSVREVTVQSGLPATRSIERLDLLDDNEHILHVRFIGGDHMLKVIGGQPGALVIETFVVDIPQGNTKDDICYFIENLLKCNLRTLADVSEECHAS
uniref:Bet v I/Major latex protein domain-containing protein n=1 Tax=Oryza brachyantha TaxID=4533 RepID=J3MEM7_ORYBR